MAGLSTMFTDWKNDQYDNFESLPDWYVENYDRIRGKIRLLVINSGNVYFESPARNSIKMMWYWIPNSEDQIKVTFEIMKVEDDLIESFKETMKEWLKTNGYNKTFNDGKKQKIAVNVSDMDAVLSLFDEFNS